MKTLQEVINGGGKADDAMLFLLEEKGEEVSSLSFDAGTATIYAIAGKFVVHETDNGSAPPVESLHFFDGQIEAAAKIVEIFEQDIRELVGSYLDENLRGCSYGGSFRPHHAFFFDLETFECSDQLDASDNYVVTNDFLAPIFDNGGEGGYDLTFFVSEAILEGREEQFFYDETRPEGWDEMDWREKTKWVEETNSELAKDAFEEWWGEIRDEIVDGAMEAIAEHAGWTAAMGHH